MSRRVVPLPEEIGYDTTLGDNLSVYGGEWLLHATVRALVEQGRAQEARVLLETKSPLLAGRPVSEAVLAWCEALLTEDESERVDRLGHAAQSFASFGWQVERARCLMDLAETIAGIGGDGEPARKEAQAILERCGAAQSR